MDDVAIAESIDDEITFIITGLVPNTQYAFYVKTYTLTDSRFGGISNISYFTTAPGSKYALPAVTPKIILSLPFLRYPSWSFMIVLKQ